MITSASSRRAPTTSRPGKARSVRQPASAQVRAMPIDSRRRPECERAAIVPGDLGLVQQDPCRRQVNDRDVRAKMPGLGVRRYGISDRSGPESPDGRQHRVGSAYLVQIQDVSAFDPQPNRRPGDARYRGPAPRARFGGNASAKTRNPSRLLAIAQRSCRNSSHVRHLAFGRGCASDRCGTVPSANGAHFDRGSSDVARAVHTGGALTVKAVTDRLA